MGSWNVEVDEAKNRLYIDLTGTLAPEMSRESTQAVVDGAAALEPGFDVVTDLQGYRPSGTEDTLERGKRAMRENDCAAAVRVMPASATASMHFERAGEDEETYPVAVAESVEQAEALLDKRRAQES